MGKIEKPQPKKLFCGLIFKDERALEPALRSLQRVFGPIDFESALLPFELTDYYAEEFGVGLKRRFVSFKRLISPDALASIKIASNRIEKRLTLNGLRRINIDPGYLDMAKLVLASTKDYVHRLYLAKGIYAEITLFFQNKSFRAWEWTYPDYRTPEYLEIFNHIRKLYAQQISHP